MIATASHPSYISAVPQPVAAVVRRRITFEAGHALEKLSHAIEYLSDEFALDPIPLASNRGRVDAIDLLMALNRRVYQECPEIPTLGQRIHNWFHHAA